MTESYAFSRCKALLLTIMGLAIPVSAQAEDRWEATFKASTFYDSQLVIEEADVSREAGDAGLKLGANLEFRPVDTDALDVKVSYDFGQSLYADFDEFNLQTHRVDASVTHTIGKVRIGLRADATHIRLAGDPFLNLVSASPSVSAFLADDIFVRGHLRIAEKTFTDLDHRDASVSQVGINLFRFHKKGRGYLLAGAQVEREDAVDPVLDFEGVSASLTFKHPLNEAANGPTVKLTSDYRERDYSVITPSIGEPRTENRFRVGGEFEFGVRDNMRAELTYRYTDRNSNLVSANYAEHRAEAGIVFTI
ncbi:porin family protein [Sphingomicrobium marinum]|uniref:hypothetical protein n=1 Tax=Sphingomicrobium marinum TaxID=1227950 RepID=UPI00223FF5A8|nr:hypothetical protein [Sphingomicrobium marinum]